MQSNLSIFKVRIWSIAKLSLLSTVVTLLGCVGPAEYVEPTGSSIASIQFSDEAPEPLAIYFHADPKECTDRSSPGLIQPKTDRTLAIPAGKNLVFTVGLNTRSGNSLVGFGLVGNLAAIAVNKGCTPTIDFVPQAGHAYIFRINSDENNCNYQFFEKPSAASQSKKAVIPVAFTEREWIRANTNSGPFCKAK